LRFMAESAPDERLLIVNLGDDVSRGSFAEPLVASVPGYEWVVQWSSEHPRYGGCGTPRIVSADGWRIPSHAATVLRPEAVHGGDGTKRG
jgi:maltooligosyltrehalose trehalohydrolase